MLLRRLLSTCFGLHRSSPHRRVLCARWQLFFCIKESCKKRDITLSTSSSVIRTSPPNRQRQNRLVPTCASREGRRSVLCIEE